MPHDAGFNRKSMPRGYLVFWYIMSIQIDMESQQHQIVLFRPGISNQPIFVLIRDIAVPT